MIYTVRGLTNARMHPTKAPISDFEVVASVYIQEIQPEDKIETVILNGQEFTKAKGELCYYFIGGEITNNYRTKDNLKSRSLLILDYDDITVPPQTFIEQVKNSIFEYSYFLYPSTSYTDEIPKFRLIVDAERNMNESEYTATIKDLAELVGFPYDPKSFAWVQLMGLPITDDIEKFNSLKVISRGFPYPVIEVHEEKKEIKSKNLHAEYQQSNFQPGKGRVVKLLEEVIFGIDEGNRNSFFARAFGTLITAKMNPELAMMQCIEWNERYCNPPLSEDELLGVIKSIGKREQRKGDSN